MYPLVIYFFLFKLYGAIETEKKNSLNSPPVAMGVGRRVGSIWELVFGGRQEETRVLDEQARFSASAGPQGTEVQKKTPKLGVWNQGIW